MKEKPILFSTPMVQAIMTGNKTMTRRVVKPQPPKICALAGRVTDSTNRKIIGCVGWETSAENVNHYAKMPYEVGDILWVRETWARLDCSCCEGDFNGICQSEADENEGCYMYRATHYITGDARWKPSIHMPRIAARLFLKVTNIRVGRLQDITEVDAVAEGFKGGYDSHGDGKFEDVSEHEWTATEEFLSLWNGIYFNVEQNPWVWVIEFEVQP